MSRSIHILVVSEAVTAARVERALGEVGEASVERAGSPAAAREAVDGARFDAVVAVHRPPGFDGMAVTRAVRAVDATVPVLLVGPSPPDAERARRAGATEVFAGTVAGSGAAIAGLVRGLARAGPSGETDDDDGHDWRERTEVMASLLEAAREFEAAGSRREVSRRLVETIDGILGLPVNGVWLADESGERLEPVAVSAAGERLFEDPPTYEPGNSVSWRAFEAGETYVTDDVSADEDRLNPDTDVRSEIVVPLEGYGVLNVGSTAPGAFDEGDVSLVELLATTAVAAMERADREERLQRATERFRRVFEAANDGLLLVDPERDAIVDCNPRICGILGYDRGELLATAPSELHGDDERFREFVASVREGKAGRTDELVCRRADGRRVPVEVSASSVAIDGRDYLLASVRDVTDRKRREQSLSVFGRVLRHNLRNDMNVILGHAYRLLDEVEGDEAEGVETIIETARKLGRLAEKARTFQQLNEDSGGSVELGAAIEHVRSHVTRIHPGATVETDVPGSVRVPAGAAVEIALRELCENAVEHADDPEPTVRVTATVTDAGVEIEVADDGPGIPETERAVLNREAETPLEHGSGLGLWLVDRIVTGAGGSVDISTGDDGTAVTVRIPTVEGAVAAPVRERSPRDPLA